MTQAKTKSINSDIFYGLITIFFSLFLSWIIPVDISYKPNIFLVSVVLIGVLLKKFNIFILFAMLQVILIRYSPFISYEIIYLFAIAVLSFIISNTLLLKENPLVPSVLVSVFVVVFYILFGGIKEMVSTMFVLELLYDLLLTIVLFEFFVWLKKKFL